MFKFNFELDDPEETETGVPYQVPVSQISEEKKINAALKCFEEHTLSALAEQLPPDISYSPLVITQPSGEDITISRRDLFDARFQLIASTSSDNPIGPDTSSTVDLDFVEAPSDLVPGVYEGGLKTWECSIDLAAVLGQVLPSPPARSQRVLEIGCGTAVPSLYVLHRLFSPPPKPERRVTIHLQDYNDLVLRLVTLPNVILTWYMSPASESFRTAAQSHPPDDQPPNETEDDTEADIFPPADPSQPGELPISPALISAFEKSLNDYGVELRFFSGSWESFNIRAAGGKYDVVLTSETIYQMDSLPSLLDLLWRACTEKDETLEELAEAKLTIGADTGVENKSCANYLCIVAAKLVYFGVGGGVREFVNAVESGIPTNHARPKGRVETIWKMEEGVKRNVMRVRWD